MTEPITPLETSLAPEAEAKDKSQAQGTVQDQTALERVHLPRIAIKFCTQCRWMLRAAYFAQELLSTFGTDLGEVSLVPVTGGVFSVTIWHAERTSRSGPSTGEVSTREVLLWDRGNDGGFPEVKKLKALVRNVIDPKRDLGHTDRALKKTEEEENARKKGEAQKNGKEACEDCK